MATNLASNALIISTSTDGECVRETSGTTCVGDDKVLKAPFTPENLGQKVMIGHGGNPVVGIVR
jgi:hypothetical protein